MGRRLLPGITGPGHAHSGGMATSQDLNDAWMEIFVTSRRKKHSEKYTTDVNGHHLSVSGSI